MTSGGFDPVAVARIAAGLAGDGDVLAVEREGAGWDHQAWRVDTADGPWIVRVAKDGTLAERARAARREAAVMPFVRRRLGVWAAEAVAVDGCLAYRRVPGVPLQDVLVKAAMAPAATADLARRVGGLIRAIAALDPAEADEPIERDDEGLPAWIEELPRLVAVVEHLLTPAQRASIERFLGAPLPAEPAQLVLLHSDLGRARDRRGRLDHRDHRLVEPLRFCPSDIARSGDI